MSEQEREFAAERYMRAAHAVQSGIKALISSGWDGSSPKHLRVGVDMSKSDQMGLARLLIAKGIITETEYHVAMADAAEEEQRRLEAELTARLGKKVTLA